MKRDPGSKSEESVVDRYNHKSQDFRAEILASPLGYLTKWGVRAPHLTNGRIGLGIVALLLFPSAPISASLIFVLALLLDLLDGSLARFQNQASDRGKFFDLLADHVVYVLILFSILSLGYDPFLISYNIFIVGLAYLLATIKKNEYGPSDWLIKPYPKVSYLKIITIVPFFLLMFFRVDIIAPALVFDNVLATLLSAFYFINIQMKNQPPTQ
jgi:phosphatidylglycerophosphate synthase